MSLKWIGAVFIFAACGGVGYSVAAAQKREEYFLHTLLDLLQFMENELRYRLTPLPQLCHLTATQTNGILQEIFSNLEQELNYQTAPDACSCMYSALQKSREVPASVRRLLIQLGNSLGKFDLEGQLSGLQAVHCRCAEEVKWCVKDCEVRQRSYRTLALCAGAALIILFI